MDGVKTMPTLKSKVTVKAMLMKALGQGKRKPEEKKASSTKQRPKAPSSSVMRILHETPTQHGRQDYPQRTGTF